MHRWKHPALAAAILVSAALPLTTASALTLGQLRVQSALGEPLRAQIAVTSLSANEAESLRANAASPDTFNRHGVSYSPLMAQLQINLQRRADGTAFLQLSTRTPVNEPFLDLVLNASWSGGEIVRSYTLLLDPTPAETAPTARTIDRPPVVAPAPNAPTVAADTSSPSDTAPANTSTVASTAAPSPAPSAAKPENRPATTGQPHSSDTYTRAYAWLQSQSNEADSAPVATTAITGITSPRDTAGSAAPAAPAASRSSADSTAPAVATRADSQRQASGYTAGATLTTRRGDNASRIARRHLPANVSLDQMLVALQRTNPKAFIQGNVNLLRAGVTLAMPELETIQAVSAQEARSIVAAQTQDFRRYQAKIAQTAPRVSADSSGQRTLSGVVTRVTDGATSGRPELVVGSPSSDEVRRAEEERLAQQRQQQENTDREQALQANIRRLEELQQQADNISRAPGSPSSDATGNGATASSATPPADATGLGIDATPPIPLPPTVSEAPAEAEATPGTSTSPDETRADAAPATSAEAPAPAAPATADTTEKAAPPAPAPVASAIDLQNNPSLLWGAAAIVLLLAGYGLYRRRKSQAQPEEEEPEDSIAPNNLRQTFFGDDANTTPDPNKQEAEGENTTPGDTFSVGYSTGVSSMSYSPSQIDASGEGDPVLEADVLLAYGRDQQAEEVLKEALQSTPERTAIHVRLAEIHATRQDRQAFAATARTLQALTQAQGTDWLKVAELGRNLDPSNPLYQPDAPLPTPDSSSPPAPEVSRTSAPATSDTTDSDSGLDFDLRAAAPASPQEKTAQPPVDLDAGLDFQPDANDNQESLPPPLTRTTSPATEKDSQGDSQFHGLDLDLDLNLEDASSVSSGTAAAMDTPKETAQQDASEHSLDLPDLTFSDSIGQDLESNLTATAKADNDDPLTSTLEFDLAALSLDLDAPASDKPQEATPPQTPKKDSGYSPSDFDLDLGLELDDTSNTADDPLSTKLALAQEFHALGDDEGARALAQEVLAEASGDLKKQAQTLLTSLD